MVQATTPTFTLKLPNSVDLTEAASVYFNLTQAQTQIQKTGEDLTVSAHQVEVYLSQAETLSLAIGNAEIQLNWVYANGARACSNIVMIPVTKNLLKAVVA